MINKDIFFLMAELSKVDSPNKHLIITGSIKIGKTFLLNNYLNTYYKSTKKRGIITNLEIPLQHNQNNVNSTNSYWISLKYLNNDTTYKIGEKVGEKMIFNSDLFTKLTLKFFNSLDKNVEIIIIDEIGYNEIGIKEFIDSLIYTFNNFRVICVIRKDKNALQNIFDKIGDFVIFDLDKYYQ